MPVLLSGGAGTRLRPVSREAHPKPFMQLADGQSLLQKTFIRAARFSGVDTILTVTNREYYSKTRDDYEALGTRNLIIVDTPDALLVADCDRTQDVKKVVEQLKLMIEVQSGDYLGEDDIVRVQDNCGRA